MKKQKVGRNRARKQAKRKAILAAKKNQRTNTALSPVRQARSASLTFGVNYCAATANLFDIGIGYVIVGRSIPPAKVATAVFLVDVYCLGVKNAYYIDYTHEQLLTLIDKLAGDEGPMVDVTPECARKIVDGSVAYAREFGLPPHADYPAAYALFGDIDIDACPVEYEFGREGKPCFITGPNDTPAKIRKIMRTLNQSAGPDNFDFILGSEGF
ncbi:MAG: hypothetical protein GY742_03570 [Hyphomicrobiales bacterium]|nr:hypothetical protein [Hyphomicrobiales bacterium]